MAQQYISEAVESFSVIERVSEENPNTKDLFIEGIFLQAEVKNRNRRVYPLQVAKSAVDKYRENYIKTGRSLGELGHPAANSGINLHLTSHIVQSLEQDGNNFMGRAKILDTPMGKIAKTLITEGVRLGVSLRGNAMLSNRNGVKYVTSDFSLLAIDIVADPSMPDAFVNGIMEQSKEFCEQGIIAEEQYEYLSESLNHLTSERMTEEKLLTIFEKFAKTLSKNKDL